MKRIFMRATWGIYDDSHRITKRRKKIDRDIVKIVKASKEFDDPFIVYVFGEDNYKRMKDFGFDCILLNKDPAPFDLIEAQYRHKLEAIRYAMEEDGCDEVLHFDWDCVPQKKLPSDFWDIMGKKESFQANLQLYHRRKATWRKEDMRKIPNGGFVYIRDKSYPGRIIEHWEKNKGPSAEPALARFSDELVGGWQGLDKYWDLFEPDFCNLHKMSAFPKDKIETKNLCFRHYQGI